MKKARMFYTFFLISFLYSGNISYLEKKAKEVVGREIASSTKLEKRNLESVDTIDISRALKSYEYMAQFPENSYPIDHRVTEDTIENKYNQDIQQKFYKNKETVNVWISKNYFKVGEDVAIYVQATGSKKLELSGVLKRSQTKLSFKRKGNKYLALVSGKSLQIGDYLSLIDIKIGEESKTFVNAFMVQDHYYDFKRVSNEKINSTGNLIFTCDFDIIKEGSYVLEGSIYYKDKLIGFSEKIVDLKKGEIDIDLDFYGKIFSDKKIDGKLELRYISLSYVKPSLASANIELIKAKTYTQTYHWDQFNKDAYNNLVLQDKISQAN